MFEYTINLDRADEVFEFCNAMSKINCNINIEPKDGSYIVNAKSVLGILSLDLNQPLGIKVDSDDPAIEIAVKNALDTFKTEHNVSEAHGPARIEVKSLVELEALIGKETVSRLFEEYKRRCRESGSDGLPPWLHAGNRLNTAAGLDMCGSPEIYLETLSSFARHAEDALPELWHVISSGDTNSLTLKTHMLKSSAALIGAEHLSALARAAEELTYEDEDYSAREKAKEAMAAYSELVEWLAPINGKPTRKRGAMIDEEDLPDLYRHLKKYIDDFNDEAVGSMIQSVTRYSLPKEHDRRFELLAKAHDDADWEKLQQLISEVVDE